MRTYTKEDVSFHSDGFRNSRPAVNVKVYDTLSDGFLAFQRYEPDASERFTEDWVRENVSEETLDAIFWQACAIGFEQIQTDAADIFGSVTVYQEGRSGGWAVVDSLPDFEEWDAIALAKWRKFERYAREQASDVMYQVVSSCYLNEFETWSDEESELAAPDLEAVLG